MDTDKIIISITTVVKEVVQVWQLIPFTGATWFVIAIFVVCVWLFTKANNDPDSPVQWEDLIVDTSYHKVSPYKIGYLVGMLVSTWIVITFADAGKLTFDIFGIYLSYLLGGAGWMNTLTKKGAQQSRGTERPALLDADDEDDEDVPAKDTKPTKDTKPLKDRI